MANRRPIIIEVVFMETGLEGNKSQDWRNTGNKTAASLRLKR